MTDVKIFPKGKKFYENFDRIFRTEPPTPSGQPDYRAGERSPSAPRGATSMIAPVQPVRLKLSPECEEE